MCRYSATYCPAAVTWWSTARASLGTSFGVRKAKEERCLQCVFHSSTTHNPHLDCANGRKPSNSCVLACCHPLLNLQYDWDSTLPGAAAVLASMPTVSVSTAARDWLETFVLAKWEVSERVMCCKGRRLAVGRVAQVTQLLLPHI